MRDYSEKGGLYGIVWRTGNCAISHSPNLINVHVFALDKLSQINHFGEGILIERNKNSLVKLFSSPDLSVPQNRGQSCVEIFLHLVEMEAIENPIF